MRTLLFIIQIDFLHCIQNICDLTRKHKRLWTIIGEFDISNDSKSI